MAAHLELMLMLGQAVAFVSIYVMQPHYGLLMGFCTRLASYAPVLAMAFMVLFGVAVLSLDVAYVLVRLGLPERETWGEQARPRWVLAWLTTWLAQVPLWFLVFPKHSLLLIHELANFALTLHHAAIHRLRPSSFAFPSATLVASTRSTQQNQSLLTHLVARTALPLVYTLCHGLPQEWRWILVLFLLDVGPLVGNSLACQLGLRRGMHSQCGELAWNLRYPAQCSAGYQGGTDMLEEDCDLHGSCSICLSNLCCPPGGAATALAAAARRRVAPGLSAARLRCRQVGAVALSATRVPAEWGGNGRIATTRCGHSFHSHCLSQAAENHPRCPHCRASIAKAEGGVELPDEDTLDSQMLSLAFGFLMGGVLLSLHWALWKLWHRILLELLDLPVGAATASLEEQPFF